MRLQQISIRRPQFDGTQAEFLQETPGSSPDAHRDDKQLLGVDGVESSLPDSRWRRRIVLGAQRPVVVDASRATSLYDRRGDGISLDEIERISC